MVNSCNMAASGSNFQSTLSLGLANHKIHFAGRGRETCIESLQLDFTETTWDPESIWDPVSSNCSYYQWQNLYFNFLFVCFPKAIPLKSDHL